MIEFEYKDYKVTITQSNHSRRTVIEAPNGLLVRSYVSPGDTDWQIDRAKIVVDEEDKRMR